MVRAGLWTGLRVKCARQEIQQPRYRRACVGELMQIDGCEHRWFENLGLPCVLQAHVDDAPSRLVQLYVVKSEPTFIYFEATHGYLEQHSEPLMFYSDMVSVYRIAIKNVIGANGQSQYT